LLDSPSTLALRAVQDGLHSMINVSNSTRIIRQVATARELSHAAAELFVSIGQQAIAARDRFTIVLAGGSTPRQLYELLAADPWRNQLDWAAVEWFFGDERAVAPEHIDSNYRMARESLLGRVDAPRQRIHRMQGERADLESAAADYQSEMASVFNCRVDAPPPVFDLVLLGMGGDGHTASLFPHTRALSIDNSWVAANEVPQLDTRRMTLTLPVLNRAANVLFLVAGADKATALADVLEGPLDSQRLPAQSVQPSAGQLTWLVDQAAAEKLTR
jgi:6-phosphogluconolactonase